MADHDIGDVAVLTGTFRNEAGVLADPTAVVVTVRKPTTDATSTETTTPLVSHTSTGVYRVDLLIDRPGVWTYEFVGTGAVTGVEGGRLYVREVGRLVSVSVEAVRLVPFRERRRPHDLMRWYLDGFRAEVPMRMVTRERWHDRDGGSLLGSPALSDDLRAYLEKPDALEEARLHDDDGVHGEESYRFPMRAALRAMAGQGGTTYAFMARVLVHVAWMAGDWDSACASAGIVEPVRRPYVMAALDRLFDLYQPRASIHADNRRPSSVNSAGEADARQAASDVQHALR